MHINTYVFRNDYSSEHFYNALLYENCHYRLNNGHHDLNYVSGQNT